MDQQGFTCVVEEISSQWQPGSGQSKAPLTPREANEKAKKIKEKIFKRQKKFSSSLLLAKNGP